MAEQRKRPVPKKNIPTRQSDEMAPNERDFWEIDDDSDPPESPSDPPESPSDPPESPSDLPGSPSDLPGSPSDLPGSPSDLPGSPSDPPGSPSDAPGSPAESPAKNAPGDDRPVGNAEPTSSTRSQASAGVLASEEPLARPSKQNTKRSKPSTTGRAEKISLLVLGVLLAGTAIGCLVLFFSKIPTAPKAIEIEFPVTGEFVTIRDIRTYWRRPHRGTDRGVRPKTRLIPAAYVTLAPSSGQGALRFFFEDDSGKLIGDSSTQVVGDGSFTANGTAEAEIHSTGGFNDSGDHAAYATGQIEPWHFIIKEGPNRNASGRDFKELLRVPISFNRQ